MAPSRTSPTSRLLPLVFFTLASLAPLSSATLDCEDIYIKKVHFNLKKLGGPHMVHWTDDRIPGLQYNYNFTVDLCNTLKRKKDEPSCHIGTRVCAIREEVDLNGEKNASVTPIDIAGSYTSLHNGQLSPTFELLRDSQSNSDQGREGFRAELHGGRFPYDDHKKGEDQRAIIEFVCDKERDGTEKGEVDDGGDREDDDGEGDGKDEKRKLRSRNDGKEGQCGDSDASLRFCGYQQEAVDKNKKATTLRLEWRTKYACEDAPQDESSHWGFFTWFIIILFLATAAYLIFGSWLNYNRYGARGWDLLPHGDTIRDIPYIFKDFGRKVINTVQGPGSRGGYSAV